MLKKKDKYIVAVVGATGAVGNEMIGVLEERNFPVEQLRLFASERSEGKTLEYNGKQVTVELLTDKVFDGIDIALFQGHPGHAQRDRLVVPEVNPDDVDWNKGIIANPNCSTIQMVVALKPIHDAATIKRVVVTTFQSVSGTGKKAMDELLNQTKDILSFNDIKPEVYPHQIAFNCIPQIDVFQDDGYTKEEVVGKMTCADL